VAANKAQQDATDETAPEDVLAALGEVIRAVSASGFDLDGVLQTIIRYAVELSGADFGNILRPQGDYYQMVAYHGEMSDAYIELVDCDFVQQYLRRIA